MAGCLESNIQMQLIEELAELRKIAFHSDHTLANYKNDPKDLSTILKFCKIVLAILKEKSLYKEIKNLEAMEQNVTEMRDHTLASLYFCNVSLNTLYSVFVEQALDHKVEITEWLKQRERSIFNPYKLMEDFCAFNYELIDMYADVHERLAVLRQMFEVREKIPDESPLKEMLKISKRATCIQEMFNDNSGGWIEVAELRKLNRWMGEVMNEDDFIKFYIKYEDRLRMLWNASNFEQNLDMITGESVGLNYKKIIDDMMNLRQEAIDYCRECVTKSRNNEQKFFDLTTKKEIVNFKGIDKLKSETISLAVFCFTNIIRFCKDFEIRLNRHMEDVNHAFRFDNLH